MAGTWLRVRVRVRVRVTIAGTIDAVSCMWDTSPGTQRGGQPATLDSGRSSPQPHASPTHPSLQMGGRTCDSEAATSATMIAVSWGMRCSGGEPCDGWCVRGVAPAARRPGARVATGAGAP
eukprot:scaffold21141_cov46-Phaeocystis_antarctica.AAC.3